MGKQHHRPLGLPGVHWQTTKCEILDGHPDGERLGTLMRERENAWRYSCGDTLAPPAYADGARLLAYYGRLRILDEYGRRVIARAPREEGE